MHKGLQPFPDEEPSEAAQGAYWKYVPKPLSVRRSQGTGGGPLGAPESTSNGSDGT